MKQRLAGLLASVTAASLTAPSIGVANYAGCAARSAFAGFAAYGCSAAKSQYYWGVLLVLLTDWRGLPTDSPSHPPTSASTSRCARSPSAAAPLTQWPTRALGAAYVETLALESVTIRAPD